MRYILLLVFIIVFTGCVRQIPTLQERTATLHTLKNKKTIIKTIDTKNFKLYSLQDVEKSCKSVKVYIEGDGLSWITKSTISDDPTPLNPIAFKLMQIDSSKCKVYLARPCQYVGAKSCDDKYWSTHRFSKEVIKSFDKALDSLKQKYQNNSFGLVGYSGGAAVAMLVATKRDDIDTITTVAGNLDIQKFTDKHNVSRLDGSLNPADFIDRLKGIKQYHLVGAKDSVIPKDIKGIKPIVYDATHSKGWEISYKRFLKEH